MKRIMLCLVMLASSVPAAARGDDAPYYGPMKRWHGIGYKTGYEDHIEKDGTWRIEAAVHGRSDAIDLALYRAAERARDEGYRFVFLLGGRGGRSPGFDWATLYARPSHEAVAPIGCRSKKATTCYTADVAEVMRILGGPNGTQPGVAIEDHRDEFGRAVYLSGYGTGGIAATMPNGVVRSNTTTIVDNKVVIRSGSSAPAVTPVPAVRSMPIVTASARPPYVPVATRVSDTPTARERFEQALKAAQPIRQGDPQQGWKISD